MSFLQEKNTVYRAATNARLSELISLLPDELCGGMGYSLIGGGKKLRPCLLLAAYEMVSDISPISDSCALDFACALEMIHTYSLIHDDLPCMDNDDYRHGKLSNHKVYGEAFATLFGDGLQSYAFETMLNAAAACTDKTYAVLAMREIALDARGMVYGQVLDLENEHNAEANENTLVTIHRYKTGGLIRAAILAGATLGGTISGDRFEALNSFADEFGLLFQITDDILDATGDSKKVGKTLGKDADNDKLTYVKLYGIDGARVLSHECAARAKAALSMFGDNARYFIELTEVTVERTF